MKIFKNIFSLFGIWSPAHIISVTILSRAKRVGIDSQGNKYYTAKPRKGYNYERRWVIYKGVPEPTKIPPEWHGWIHHQSNQVPANDIKSFRRPWQKPHAQNMTGTTEAYHPVKRALEANDSMPPLITKDYEAWTPPK